MSIAVIPSRFGSKRLNGDTLVSIKKAPMIYMIYGQAIKPRPCGYKIKRSTTKDNAPKINRPEDILPIEKRIWVQ